MGSVNQGAEEVNGDISDVSWLDWPALILFFILMFLVGLQFISRYIFNDSIAWTEEIARYLLITVGFFGAISCARRESHIALTFAYRYLPSVAIKPLILFVCACNFSFFVFLASSAVEMAERTQFQSMVSLDLPKSIVHYGVAIACSIVVIVTILSFKRTWSTNSAVLVENYKSKV